ncbi:unnamed protein product [Protopolystoma xenopodis]|uniref:Uncharacterized protein n=1 Tax=Protopolystoma xenopodis TaxID=117903 RepID=A0A3S5FC27_9PLAT|nr:unnamed protein product [Protopolystoma xenopodis]
MSVLDAVASGWTPSISLGLTICPPSRHAVHLRLVLGPCLICLLPRCPTANASAAGCTFSNASKLCSGFWGPLVSCKSLARTLSLSERLFRITLAAEAELSDVLEKMMLSDAEAFPHRRYLRRSEKQDSKQNHSTIQIRSGTNSSVSGEIRLDEDSGCENPIKHGKETCWLKVTENWLTRPEAKGDSSYEELRHVKEIRREQEDNCYYSSNDDEQVIQRRQQERQNAIRRRKMLLRALQDIEDRRSLVLIHR